MFAITSKLKVLTPLKFVNRPATTHARILNRALSSMATKPVPILATGRAEAIGRVVIDSLKPDFEVIHFVLADAIEKELPLLIRGEVPASPSSTLGTGNWSEPPRALMLGGAYTDENIAQLQKLVEETPGSRKITWIRVAPPGPNSPPLGPQYAVHVAERCKQGWKKFEEEGKLDEEGGVLVI